MVFLYILFCIAFVMLLMALREQSQKMSGAQKLFDSCSNCSRHTEVIVTGFPEMPFLCTSCESILSERVCAWCEKLQLDGFMHGVGYEKICEECNTNRKIDYK